MGLTLFSFANGMAVFETECWFSHEPLAPVPLLIGRPFIVKDALVMFHQWEVIAARWPLDSWGSLCEFEWDTHQGLNKVAFLHLKEGRMGSCFHLGKRDRR